MAQVKLRPIMKSKAQTVYGITIPISRCERFKNVFFDIQFYEGCIVLLSGAQPSAERGE